MMIWMDMTFHNYFYPELIQFVCDSLVHISSIIHHFGISRLVDSKLTVKWPWGPPICSDMTAMNYITLRHCALAEKHLWRSGWQDSNSLSDSCLPTAWVIYTSRVLMIIRSVSLPSGWTRLLQSLMTKGWYICTMIFHLLPSSKQFIWYSHL